MAVPKPRRGDALLIIDMINTFAFEEGAALAKHANAIGDAVHALRTQCHRHKLPVIYVNDNFGQWRQDFEELLRKVARSGSRGQKLAARLRPTRKDLVILKPRHSVFYQTPLPTLLNTLEVRRLILTGISADSCILSSATEAHVRDYTLWVPGNVVASITPQRTTRALAYICESLGGETAEFKISSF